MAVYLSSDNTMHTDVIACVCGACPPRPVVSDISSWMGGRDLGACIESRV